eukprot:COSAG01_NODE_75869_length_192_cov_27.247312_1_plen_44_part_10
MFYELSFNILLLSGTTFNLLQKINRDQFSVRYDKVLYMKRSREF